MNLAWSPPLHSTACPWSGRTYTIAHRENRGKEHPAACLIDPVDDPSVSIGTGPVLT